MSHPDPRLRRLGAVACVVLLVATAGCGALGGSDGTPPATDRGTYDVDENYDPEVLPGLTGAEVTDRIALRNAHFDALEGTSYRVTHHTIVRNGAGEVVSDRNQTVIVAGDRSEVVVDVESGSGEAQTTHLWVDGETELLREVDASGAVTYRQSNPFGPLTPSLPLSLLDLYAAVETVTVERDGDTERYRLEGTGDLTTYRNASIEIVLTEAGYIDRYHVEVEYARGGDSLSAEHVGSFERLDGGDLEAPDWIGEARERAETSGGPGGGHWPEAVGGAPAEVHDSDSPFPDPTDDD